MANMQVTAELIDKMSGPLKTLSSLWSEFSQGVVEGAKAELEAMRATEKLADSQKKLGKESKEATQNQNGLTESLKTLGKALAGLAIAGAVFDQFKGAVEAADKLDDLSEKTGIAASKLQEYQFAAKMGGSSLEGLIGGLNKLNKSIAKSEEESSRQAKAFEILGVSAEDSSGQLKDSETLFGELADKFKDLKDGPEKSALAFAVFGEKAKELLPLLNRGSEGIAELRKEAETLSGANLFNFDAYTKSAGDFFDGLDKLKLLFTGLINQIAAEVIPIFNVLIESFIDSYKNGGMVAQVIEAIRVVAIGAFVPAFKVVVLVVRGFIDTLELAGKGIAALAAAVAAFASGDVKGAKQIMSEFGKDVDDVADKHEKFKEKLFDAGNAAVDTSTKVEKKTTPSIKGLGKAAKEAESEVAKLAKTLAVDLATFDMPELSKKITEAYAKAQQDIAKGVNPKQVVADLKEVLAILTQLDEKRKERDRQKSEAQLLESDTAMAQEVMFMQRALELFPKDEAARAKYIAQLKDEYEYRKKLDELDKNTKGGGNPGGVIEDASGKRTYSDQREAARAAVRDSLDATKQIEDAAKKTEATTKEIIAASYNSVLEDVRGKLVIAAQLLEQGKISQDDWLRYAETQTKRLEAFNKEAADEITLFWQEAAKNMQSAMGDFFFDVMQGKISSLGDRFKQMLDRMVADALAANLAEALFGKGFSKTGNLGGWVGQGLSWLGGFFGGTGRAIGGDVMAGGSYMVGEKGPEPFIPKVSGTVIPTGSILASYGAGKGSNVNFNITAMDSQDVARAIHNNRRQIAEIINGTNRGYGMGV